MASSLASPCSSHRAAFTRAAPLSLLETLPSLGFQTWRPLGFSPRYWLSPLACVLIFSASKHSRARSSAPLTQTHTHTLWQPCLPGTHEGVSWQRCYWCSGRPSTRRCSAGSHTPRSSHNLSPEPQALTKTSVSMGQRPNSGQRTMMLCLDTGHPSWAPACLPLP